MTKLYKIKSESAAAIETAATGHSSPALTVNELTKLVINLIITKLTKTIIINLIKNNYFQCINFLTIVLFVIMK